MDTVYKQADEQTEKNDHDKPEHRHCEHRHDHDHGHHDEHHHEHDDWKERYEKEKRHEEYKLHHIYKLEKTIKKLADSLAELGRGAYLHELLGIIHKPGWTTKAELAFANAILDQVGVQIRALERLQDDLVDASRKVTYDGKDKHDDDK